MSRAVSVTVVLCGDVMTGRGIDQVLRTPSEPCLHEAHVRDARDYVRLAERAEGPIGLGLADDAIWGVGLDHLRRLQPDLFVVNLETAVTTADQAWPGKAVHYRMHPGNVGCLTAAGIGCCALANNHVLDWGRTGLEQTLLTLHAAGLSTVGAGLDADAAWTPAGWSLDGGARLRVLACAIASSGTPSGWAAAADRSGVAWLPDLSEASIRRVARALQGPGDEHTRTIVSIHWGDNWVERVPDEHRHFAHRLIELGVDLVHGHSSHHPLPLEVYRDRLILYGCGDLINDYAGIPAPGSHRSDLACLYAATLDAGSGRLTALRIVPLQLRRFRLVDADAAGRAWALGQFNAGSSRFGARVIAAGTGRGELVASLAPP